MSKPSIKTMMAALLAGSIAASASGVALARTDGASFDPARIQQHLEKRVDRALSGTDATAEQKSKVTAIMQSAFADMKPLRAKRAENRKAMTDVLQAPSIDRLKIEQLRVEQMRMVDEASKRFSTAMADAGDVLSQAQRQAFVKQWTERRTKRGG